MLIPARSCELPETDLPEELHYSVTVSTQDPAQQSVPNETSLTPLVEVPPPVQGLPQEQLEVPDNSVSTFPDRRS